MSEKVGMEFSMFVSFSKFQVRSFEVVHEEFFDLILECVMSREGSTEVVCERVDGVDVDVIQMAVV